MTSTVSPPITSAGYAAIRTAIGLLDIDLRYIEVTGPGDLELLDAQISRSVGFLLEGQILAALLLTDDGLILSECAVYRQSNGYLIELPGSTVDAVVDRLSVGRASVRRRDDLRSYGLEGPYAWQLAGPLIDFPISSMAYQSSADGIWEGRAVTVARTGVTGEYGYRVVVPAEDGVEFRTWAVEAGAVQADDDDIAACRCEMRFPLVGMGSALAEYSPFELGIQWMIDFEHGFEGRQALLERERTSNPICWAGGSDLTAPPKPGSILTIDGQEVGRITEARFSPRLEQTIGTAVVGRDVAASGVDYDCEGGSVIALSGPFMVTDSFEVPIE